MESTQAVGDVAPPRRDPPALALAALQTWEFLGGIDWLGLEVAAERFGVTDVETLIDQLMIIRKFTNGQR